ncbi:MAG TPA: hypothetical protein VJ302_32660 [Blastocatellia bacterium]|nr:hypothetical protein [Blastocatellia bacterium]
MTDEICPIAYTIGAARDYTSADRSRSEARIRQIVPHPVPAQRGNIRGPQNNTACTDETVIPTNFQPNGFHRRVSPQRLSLVRTPIANQITRTSYAPAR